MPSHHPGYPCVGRAGIARPEVGKGLPAGRRVPDTQQLFTATIAQLCFQPWNSMSAWEVAANLLAVPPGPAAKWL